MKKYLKLFLLFLCCNSTLLAYSLAQDSVIYAQLRVLKPSFEVIDSLNIASNKTITSDPTLAGDMANLALQFGQQINYRKGMAEACFNLSIVLERKGSYSGAAIKAMHAVYQLQLLHDTVGMVKAYELTADNFALLKNYKQANYYYATALRTAQSIRHADTSFYKLRQIEMLFELYDYKSCFNKILSLYYVDKINNELTDAKCQSMMAIAVADFDTSLLYINKSNALFEKLNNSIGLETNTYRLINIYLRNKSPQKAIDIIDAYKGSRYVNEAAYYKAYAFKMLGKGDEARVLAEQCFLDCKKVGNWAYADSSLMLLEGLYKAKGQVVNQLRVSEDRREVALLLAAWNLYNEKENLVANYEIDKAEQQYLPLLYPVAPEKKSNTIIITRTKVFVFMSILLLVALYVSRLYQKVKRLESK